MKQSWKTLFLLTFFCNFGLMTSARAQIIPDNSLGVESSTIGQPNQTINGIPINQIDQINGGVRRGGNLFHSFGEFNVNAGRGAYFSNPDGVGNILTRVTGVNRSNILGTLGVLVGNANLFLINPNGIFFGPNASLDVRGSFFGSSANSLLFDNGFEFSATNPQAPPLLTVNIPIGLRFRDNPSNITNASSNFGLKVPSGQTLALVGGNVSMDGGQLNAYSGRVELGGLAEPGTLALSVDGDNLSLRFPDNVKRASVSLTNRSGVFVSGAGGGNIAVNAKNLDILGGSILSAGIGEGLGTPETVAGDIALNATGRVTINQASRLSNRVASGATGNAGNINIKAAGDISINNLVRTPALDAESSGRGRSGNVSLQANGSIFVTGQNVQNTDAVISTFSGGQSLGSGDISLNASGGGIFLNNAFFGAASFGGNGGNISLQGNEISLANNSSLVSQSFGGGNSGSITLNSNGPISIQNTLVNTAVSSDENTTNLELGNAGDINISGRSVSITGGSEISSRSFSGVNSGNIQVNGTEFVDISGRASQFPRPDNDRATSFPYTTLATTSEQLASGASGDITVNTPNLRISDGASVRADTRSNFRGGSIDIKANVAISDGGEVTVASQGQGQGGEISITGNTLTLDRGIINASTQSGDGGNINLRLRNFIRLRNESLISANAGGQQGGNGGNITINTPFIVAFPRNNDITANAGSGSGGRVIINATLFGIARLSAEDLRRLRPNDSDPSPRQIPTSDITAVSRDNPSLSGNVQVNSPDVDPSRGLVELPETVTDTTQKVAQNPCRQGFGNEFVVTGRGGLPTSPNETLSSNNVRVDLLQPVASSGNSPSATIKPATNPIATRVPAQGWIFNDKGQVVLTAYDPTNTGSQRPFSNAAAACPAR